MRDYGVAGQLGHEKTPQLYVQHLVAIFREVRRVLKPTGTVWLNLGDSYASGKGTCYNPGGGDNSFPNAAKEAGAIPLDRGNKSTLDIIGLKPKDLIGIPWRVALALQEDGWYLRADIIWAKPNCMPESVTDRPTRSHEHIFLLTKNARYWYDADAIRESNADPNRVNFNPGIGIKTEDYKNATGDNHRGFKDCDKYIGSGRNARDVWTFPPGNYKEAHFATFPAELPKRCILAGCPSRVCSKCGGPWVNEINYEKTTARQGEGYTRDSGRNDSNGPGSYLGGKRDIIGTRPTCSCAAEYRPGIVLDPFAGSGTTGMVAKSLGREYILIELNPKYEALIQKRLDSVQEPISGLI